MDCNMDGKVSVNPCPLPDASPSKVAVNRRSGFR